MQKTFTPILWTYQDFKNTHTNDLLDISKLFEPSSLFINVIEKLDKKAPDISEKTLKKIFEKIN